MIRFSKALCALSTAALASGSVLAGVSVSTSSDATLWPGSPAVTTYALPNVPITASSNVPENFGGNGTNPSGRSVSQTFSPTSTFNLGRVVILATGAGGGDPHQIRLFDVTGIAGNQSSYAPGALNGGTDLLGGLSFTAPGLTNGLAIFDFDAASQPLLTSGRRYAFEIWGPPTATGSGPFLWFRGGGGISTYLLGDGYEGQITRDDNMNGIFAPIDLNEVRTQLAGGSRDLVLGVYAVPEPAAMGVIALAAMIARRRRA